MINLIKWIRDFFMLLMAGIILIIDQEVKYQKNKRKCLKEKRLTKN